MTSLNILFPVKFIGKTLLQMLYIKNNKYMQAIVLFDNSIWKKHVQRIIIFTAFIYTQ